MARVRRSCAVIALLAGSLTACGTNTIRADQAEQTVARFVYQQTGFRATDVRCASGVAARVGGTFDCHFSGPDAPYTAHVRITSVHGERVGESIATRPSNGAEPRLTIKVRATEQTVTAAVVKRTGFTPTDVRCPFGIPATVGAEFDCRFTGPDGSYIAHVRVASIHGQRALDEVVTHRVSP